MCSLFSHRLKIMAKNAPAEPQPASASKVEAKMEEEKTFECWNNVAHNLVVLNSLHFLGGRIKFGTNGISLKNITRVAKSCPESWSVVKVLRCFCHNLCYFLVFSLSSWVLPPFGFLCFFLTIWVFKFCHNFSITSTPWQPTNSQGSFSRFLRFFVHIHNIALTF